MTQPLEALLEVLRCPRSRSELRLHEGMLLSGEGDAYPVVDGKPILVKDVRPLHLERPRDEIVSRNVASFDVPADIGVSATLVLHLGSGNVPSTDPRVVSVDVLPCENVDVVGEAEALPFADESFDYVESGAVFEHLHDPLSAAAEVRRVLKPGGRFRIDTAFLQGYHGYPGHYFNMTPQAVETFLVDDFDLVLATVPDSATPVHSLLDLLERFLYHMPAADRDELLARPLADVIGLLRSDETRASPLLAAFDEHALRALCASFVVVAEKPAAYEESRARRAAEGEAAFDAWQALKRDYYTARTGVIQRHYEVGFRRRLASESGQMLPPMPDPEPLDAILERCAPASMLDPALVGAAVGALTEAEAELVALRDGAAPTQSILRRARRKLTRSLRI